MSYSPFESRYDGMTYRRSGRSGLQAPADLARALAQFRPQRARRTRRASFAARPSTSASPISTSPTITARRPAPPRSSSARSCEPTSAPYRDELIISTKAGYGMWPGPYGEWGSRKYLLASLDQSLKRMGLDYVDIFYSHRFDPDTPLEETMGALDTAVRQGKALYVGISSYNRQAHRARRRRSCAPRHALRSSTSRAIRCSTAGSRRTSSSTRWRAKASAASPSRRWRRACSPTSISTGVPADSRAAQRLRSWRPDFLSEENLACIRALNEHRQEARPDAGADGARLGAPRPAHDLGADRREPVGADRRRGQGRSATLEFSAAELAEIDATAKDAGVNIWKLSSTS